MGGSQWVPGPPVGPQGSIGVDEGVLKGSQRVPKGLEGGKGGMGGPKGFPVLQWVPRGP